MVRICLAAINSPFSYSGGRYHAWILAEGLAAAGYDVTYWTNAHPLVSRDFRGYPGHKRIKLHIDPLFASPPQSHFDIGWVVPHYGDVGSFHRWMAFLNSAARIRLLLNFETPNWYQSVGQTEIDESRWLGWTLASRCCEGVVSSLRLSSDFAEKYFGDPEKRTDFYTLMPPINSIAADLTVNTDRIPGRVFAATRLNRGTSGHKGGGVLTSLLSEEMRGRELVVLLGGSSSDKTAMRALKDKAAASGVKLRFMTGVTDDEKFRAIRSAEVSVFPSSFEGYGYPPIESIYCDTPCVAYALPNYDETCGTGVTQVRQGDLLELSRRIRNREYTASKAAFQQGRETGSFEHFIGRVTELIEKVVKLQRDESKFAAAIDELRVNASRMTAMRRFSRTIMGKVSPDLGGLLRPVVSSLRLR